MNGKVIVLYGGSFNPPTNAHIELAQEVINKYDQIEKIIFMPVSNNYNKKGLVDNEHRYNMLKLVCDKNVKFQVSRIEIDFPRQLYTIETLKLLQNQYPTYSLWFMIGTDNLKELETWKQPEELMSKYKILVLNRKNDNMEEIIESDILLKKNKETFLKIENREIDISSSGVRLGIENSEDIKDKIPIKVYNYIVEKHLYKK